MRILLLLILAGVGAYFTVPTRAVHEEALRSFMEAQTQENTEAVKQTGISLDSLVDFAAGMIAGQGRYETYGLASKFTVDAPGSAYVECWGAFTLVQCRRVDRASGQS